jgi:hypothetical protein
MKPIKTMFSIIHTDQFGSSHRVSTRYWDRACDATRAMNRMTANYPYHRRIDYSVGSSLIDTEFMHPITFSRKGK